MNPDAIIPSIDPIPLPAPVWLFKVLLMTTFILHIIAMNFVLGGGVLSVVARLKGKTNELFFKVAGDIGKKIPAFMAATITLGVAPLLFVQVLYGQFFYTSSILLGWIWFMVIIFLVVNYYGFYLVAFKDDQRTAARGWIMLVSVLLIFTIGFIYSNNFTLMTTPGVWKARYLADPAGWNLNWQDTTLIPRFLHFFVASLAVGGLFVVSMGLFRWKKEPEYARVLISFGGKWFLYATLVQFLVGIWFLISLPREQMLIFMGDNLLATVSFGIAIVAALAALFLMASSLRTDDPRKGMLVSIGLTGVVVVFMSIMRDALRDAALAPYLQQQSFTVKTQWDVLSIFLVLFIGGLLLWFTMIKKYFFPARPQTE